MTDEKRQIAKELWETEKCPECGNQLEYDGGIAGSFLEEVHFYYCQECGHEYDLVKEADGFRLDP